MDGFYNDFPRVLISSYNWAIISGVFSGTIESYIELQFCAYKLMCFKYDCQPRDMGDWLNAYREVKYAKQ